MKKVGRNELCPCGSGAKFKKCCLNNSELENQISLDQLQHQLVEDEQNLLLSDLLDSCSNIANEMRKFQLISTVSILSTLLTKRELQSNMYRLEALVKLAICSCNGLLKPNVQIINRWFRMAGDTFCGQYDDPAENVFVHSINTYIGDFRIINGLSSGDGFYLQHIAKVVQYMPDNQQYMEVKKPFFDLLTISEEIVRRSRLEKFCFGEECPLEKIPRNILNDAVSKDVPTRFTLSELVKLGVNPESLECFTHSLNKKDGWGNSFFINGIIDNHSVIKDQDSYLITLPSCISLCLKNFIVGWCVNTDQREILMASLKCSYFEEINRSTRVLDSIENIQFEDLGEALYELKELDKRRYCLTIFLFDDFEGCDARFPTNFGYSKRVAGLLDSILGKIKKMLSGEKNFNLLVFLVMVGLGRLRLLPFQTERSKNWIFECLSIYDYITLIQLNDFSFLDVFRIKTGEKLLKNTGIEIGNINGLINLIACSRKNGGQILAEHKLGSKFDLRKQNSVLIEQNALRHIRKECLDEFDPISIEYTNGTHLVGYKSQALFEKSENVHLYHCAMDRKPLAVYLTPCRNWWVKMSTQKMESLDFAGQLWEMIELWLSRSAPILDDILKNTLLPKAILWDISFDKIAFDPKIQDSQEIVLNTKNLVKRDFRYKINRSEKKIKTIISEGFFHAFQFEENHAERAFVYSMVKSSLDFFRKKVTHSELEKIINKIIPSSHVRQIHFPKTQTYRDYMLSFLDKSVIKFEKPNMFDTANLKIKLAYFDEAYFETKTLKGVNKCTTYLNYLVAHLENKLCDKLRFFQKENFIYEILINHESAKLDMRQWEISVRSLLSTHSNSDFVNVKIFEKRNQITAISTATRILIEAGICECRKNGINSIGNLDISSLFSIALAIFHYGGVSDAIRWGAIEPVLNLTPLGDIKHSQGFMDTILAPFTENFSTKVTQDQFEGYSRLYKLPVPIASLQDSFELSFQKSVVCEFNLSINQLFLLLDLLEIEGINRKKPIFSIMKSEMIALGKHNPSLGEEAIENILLHFSIWPRDRWHQIPSGCLDKDRFPWRYRRKLSLTRRPIIQLNTETDPKLLIAPRLIRESFWYTIQQLYKGELPEEQFHSKEMKSWIGKSNGTKRLEFNNIVALKLSEFGWNCLPEINLTQILDGPQYKKYGDVDVLAWNNLGRVLIVECKDLHFRKTYGEIAEQLSNYRGIINEKGKPDYLKKHLDRFELLSKQIDRVSSFLGKNDIKLESHIVFRNLVPMKYTQEKLRDKVKISTLDELGNI